MKYGISPTSVYSLSQRILIPATIQDDKVAVHLVRNALSGNHHELIAGRLAFSSPFARRVRDDITVQMAFFGVPGVETGNKALS